MCWWRHEVFKASEEPPGNADVHLKSKLFAKILKIAQISIFFFFTSHKYIIYQIHLKKETGNPYFSIPCPPGVFCKNYT